MSFVNENREDYGKYIGSNNLFYDYIAGNVTIATPTVTYRKQVFDEVGFFDETLIFEDYDMYLRILYKKSAVFIDAYTVLYKKYDVSIQKNREIEVYNEFLKILNKWDFLPNFWYYKNKRHQFTFCQLAVKNKKEAIKHLLPGLTIFWKLRLYKNIFKLVFVWK